MPPAGIPAMTSIIDAVEEVLVSDDWKFARDEGGQMIRFGLSGDVHQYQCIFVADDSNHVLMLYTVAPVKVPEGSRLSVCEFLTRANYNMKIGNFELDMSDGEVRFKTSLASEDVTITPTIIRNMMSVNFHTMDDYMPGLTVILRQGLPAADVIAMIERVQ